jgi:hypothetical protein
MSSSRRDFLLRSSLVSLGGTGLFISACGGGGGGTVTLTRDVKGQVLVEPWIQLPKESMDAIKKDHLAELVSYNIGINDEKSCLTLSPKPYLGVWVIFGTTKVMVDSAGKFTIPSGSIGNSLFVVRNVTSATHEFAMSAREFQLADYHTFTVTYIHQGAQAMATNGRGVNPSCHTPGTSRSRGETRCKSWDGYWPTTPDTPQVSPAGLRAYIGSTCWKLVDSGLCVNERAVIMNAVRMIDGPACRDNHGYRYCQEVDNEDYSLSAPKTIKSGDKFIITVRNNTADYHSYIRANIPGNFEWSGNYAFADGENAIVLHIDKELKKHVPVRELVFVPFPTKARDISKKITITAQSYSKTVKCEIDVSDGPPMTLAEYKSQMRDINDQFKMGRTEVTVAMWKEYCTKTGRAMPPAPDWGWIDSHPIVCVTWYDCNDYANWAGLRLPTGDEWELAATNGDGRIYPWGNDWDPSKCVNWNHGSTAPVGSIPSGNSPFGCSDMSGNVQEWCANDYLIGKEVRSGSWYYVDPVYFRCANRYLGHLGYWGIHVGFRLSAGLS